MKKRKSSASSSLLRFVPENYIKKIKFNPKQIEEHLNEDIWVIIMEFLTAQEVLLTMMLVSKKLFQYAHEVPLKLDHISSIKIRADIPSRDAPCLFNRFIDEQLTNDVIFEANKLMNSDKILGLTSITLSPNFTCAIQSMFKDNSKLKNLKELTICQGCFYPKTYESILQNSNLTNIESVTLDFNEKKCGRCESSISVTSLAQSPIFKNARSFHILYGDVFRDNEIMELLHSPNFQNINNITLECDDGLTIKTIQTLASSNLDIHYLKIAAPSDYTSNSLLEAATNAKPFRNLHTLSILFQYCDPIQNATFMKFVKQGPQRNIKCLELSYKMLTIM
ncbi:hypothetical protein C9374_006031 [Naegleria lovaniensis]|uniref:F-box domain-containing protein n=1 Tax=Naegleria lovaniensis TaxID=51637 RepID=A0AA88KHY9_NAELO|nr:uncharacterized protein C9374_006031 [Naegleria lovaniensis]KAG2381647.1 hypothetical protein C9374_006031 [Naegleria lovaniensis]